MSTDRLDLNTEPKTVGIRRRRAVQLSFALGTSLFGGGGLAGSAAAQSTSTWIRASLRGQTATDVDFGGDSEPAAETRIADELPETQPPDLIARRDAAAEQPTVEVVTPAVSADQFAAALDASGYGYAEITDGLTQQTRDETIAVIENRLAAAGIQDGTVQQGRDETGPVIVVEIPETQRQDIVALLELRGVVQIDIYHQRDGEYVIEPGVVTAADLQRVGTAVEDDRTGPHVPIVLWPEAAERFQQRAVETGVAGDGGSRCTYDQSPQSTEPCLLVAVDDSVVNSFGMSSGLATSMQNGEWASDPSFILTATSFAEAQRLAISLRAGALPAPLSVTTSSELPVEESTLEKRANATTEAGVASESELRSDSGSGTSIEVPGFGVGAAATALGSVSLLLRRRLRRSDSD